MLDIFKHKSLPSVGQENSQDAFAICDIAGLAQIADTVPSKGAHSKESCRGPWYGHKSYDVSLSQIRSGDLSGVAKSDEYMSKLEVGIPMTRAFKTTLNVVGGVPDIGAYLAGVPLNMRRRERVSSEKAPLSIFLSLELSAEINIETMRKRGAAILALVRLLSATRPVELYVCCSVGGYNYAAHLLCKLDTAPLDLARAAHIMTCPSVTRGIGYAVCCKVTKDQLGLDWGGGWAYGDENVYRRSARETFLSVTNPNAETLYLTAAHIDDSSVQSPEQWIKEKLVEYGGLELEDAA